MKSLGDGLILSKSLRNNHLFLDFLKAIIKTAILFFYLFEFPIAGFFTTRRIIALYCFVYVIIKLFPKDDYLIRNGYVRTILRFFGLLIVPFFLVSINNIGLNKVNGYDYFELHYFFYIFLYIFVMALYCVFSFKNIYSFLYSYVFIMIIQSIMIFMAAVSKTFRLFLYHNTYFGDNRLEMGINSGTRIIGLNLHSAVGSIVLLVALICLIVLIRDRKLNPIIFSIVFLFVLGATALIARTGFYGGLIIGIYYLFFIKDKAINKIIFIIVAIIMVTIIITFLSSRLNDTIFTLIENWVFEIFNSETRYNTIDALQKMEIPQLTMETLFGTNVIRGYSSLGTRISHDSGYVEMYFSLGLIGAFFYYICFLSLFITFINKLKKNKKSFYYLLLVIMFFIELKEPFILKYIYTFFLLTTILFESKQEKVGAEVNG